MKQVVICNPDLKENKKFSIIQQQKFEMEGIEVHCALIDLKNPEAFLNQELPPYSVLLEKKAFSCNYRDKGIILNAAAKYNYVSNADKNYIVDAYTGIGSDFIAKVVGVGKKVNDLKIGDRVINNGSYPNRFESTRNVPGFRLGLPTNNASSRFEIAHRTKVTGIPNDMSLEVAAGFTIGAQTCFGMIRRLRLKSGDNILITAAKSNTSIFMLNALAHRKDVNIYLASTSKKFQSELDELGISEYLLINEDESLFIERDQHKLPVFGFDVVIDPFSDIYFSRVLKYMAIGGRYISCGFHDQYSHITRKTYKIFKADFNKLMSHITLNNISVLGNCLGLDQDLQSAIEAHLIGKFPIIIDRTFSLTDSTFSFFLRTYLEKDRFGKVIFKY